MCEQNIDKLQEKLQYTFKDIELLRQALTHSSFSNENKTLSLSSNERFEFLGDSLLNLIIADLIFFENADLSEGKMTKLRASLVCERTLADISRGLDVGSNISLGKGEVLGGGKDRPSILADCFEAIVAAIYLDGGFEATKKAIHHIFTDHIKYSTNYDSDFKSLLQEYIQSKKGQTVSYSLISQQGPDHDKLFTVSISINGENIATGSGRSIKTAEQNAAKSAYELLS